jgi:cobalt-zinc-cadmium resistance protein CzcA
MILLAGSLLLIPRIGAEFMPQLDEGALWVRATMPYTISFDESAKITPQIRAMLKSFPEVTTVASELAGPTTARIQPAFSTSSFTSGSNLTRNGPARIAPRPKLIEAINEKLQSFPGIIFNYTQPAEDAVDEAESGLKSALAVKVFGSDLDVRSNKRARPSKNPGAGARHPRCDPGEGTRPAQPGHQNQPRHDCPLRRERRRHQCLDHDRHRRRRGHPGGAGEKQFDLVVRLERQYRDNPEEIGNILVPTPGGQQIPLKEFADIQVTNGASFIYRQDNSRYIGVQFSVEGRDLAGAVEDAIQQVKGARSPARGLPDLDWGGEYTEYTASRAQLNVILPLTLCLIFLLLFALYSNLKFPFITVLGVVLSAPVGGLVALWITGTPFSVSSGIGFLALFGVSVQTAVVYISYVNELRRGGTDLTEAIREGAILRLRPIMMTALVAALGLLPAALATGVGTDTQRPFALVIVSGLFTRF